MRDKLIKNVQKEASQQEMLKDLSDLKKIGWNTYHLKLLKKHFSFYRGLISETIKPKNSKHEAFIKKVGNWRDQKPSNVHEEIYINYIKFKVHQYQSKKNKSKEDKKDPVWGNIPESPDGSKQYPAEVVQKWRDSAPEPITVDEWYDDWKYR